MDKPIKIGILPRTIAKIGVLWALLVMAVLLWQYSTYSGVFSILAEWQFGTFDTMFPIATIAVIVALLSLPFVVAFVLQKRRLRNRERVADRGSVKGRNQIVFLALAGAAVLAFVCGVVFAVLGFTGGGLADSGKTNSILALDRISVTDGAQVRARGWALKNRIGFYNERAIFSSRELYVVPVTISDESTRLQVFQQIDRPVSATRETQILEDTLRPERRQFSGVIRRSALPGGLARLYLSAGYEIEDPTYIVFKDRASAQWPYFNAAIDCAILTLLFAISAVLMKWHMRRQLAKGRGHQST